MALARCDTPTVDPEGIMRKALITGVTGQDGSYLAEHLLDEGYEVHGTIRTTTRDLSATSIGHLLATDPPRITLHVTDLGDSHSLTRLIRPSIRMGSTTSPPSLTSGSRSISRYTPGM